MPTYYIKQSPIQQVHSHKDLGILTNDKLDWSDHCQVISNKAIARINLIFRVFTYSNVQTLVKLYCTFVRPLLESCTPIWSPHHLKDIDAIEHVQRYFTRRLPGFASLPYNERLELLNLPPLELRRIRFDLLCVFDILNSNLYTNSHNMFLYHNESILSSVRTRGHSKKLLITRTNYELTKLSLFHRVLPVWNSLNDECILSVSCEQFKNRLSNNHLMSFMRGRAFN